MLYRYLLLILAGTALLLGIQIPNFVDQYQKRLDAHLVEVETNLRGFQQIADRFDKGSLDALIARHEASSDPAFRAEAVPLRDMVGRRAAFRAEALALQAPLPQQVMHLALRGNRPLIAETRAAYSFNIPLTRDAVLAGAVSALAVVLVLELLSWPLRRARRGGVPVRGGSARLRDL